MRLTLKQFVELGPCLSPALTAPSLPTNGFDDTRLVLFF